MHPIELHVWSKCLWIRLFLFFNYSSSPHILPFWPDEEQRHWVQAAGAEAAWLSEDPAMSLSVWFGRALVAPWAPPVLGWPGLCSPSHPTPWSCSFKSNKQIARRWAVGKIAAPIGHCNGWFKSHGDPSFYFFVWLQLWKMQSSWIPAGSLIQQKCQEIKLSATCKRVKVLENALKHNSSI